ncbi:MAG: FAD-dependent oxidoreductase [Treponema sp.]|nr:FAD-dependent oxidoreductase [Treponema sp.]
MEFDANLLIVGAGPAGLTAAQYGARANLKVLVIEQLAPGGQAALIDILENYPGNMELKDGKGNVTAKSRTGFELMQDMHGQAKAFGASFVSEEVCEIRKENGLFTAVLGDGGTLKAPAVILATGASHRSLGVPGEKEFNGRGVSYCATCDGSFFKGKKIFVVGGGDAACDGAQYLSRLSPNVILAHRRDRFRAQPAVANRVLQNPNIEVRFNTTVKEIKGGPKLGSVVLQQDGQTHEEAADAVFVFVGMVPRSALVSRDGLRAELDNDGYVVTDQKMASSIPGLFVAGDVRSGSFRQVIVAAGEGAVAAHSAAEYIEGCNKELTAGCTLKQAPGI